uniref:Uncharacterized protein n=1 Tax=Cacopsylla melanoneura TaxID=428564 RepID=A0A8D8VW90_9HEMI
MRRTYTKYGLNCVLVTHILYEHDNFYFFFFHLDISTYFQPSHFAFFFSFAHFTEVFEANLRILSLCVLPTVNLLFSPLHYLRFLFYLLFEKVNYPNLSFR